MKAFRMALYLVLLSGAGCDPGWGYGSSGQGQAGEYVIESSVDRVTVSVGASLLTSDLSVHWTIKNDSAVAAPFPGRLVVQDARGRTLDYLSHDDAHVERCKGGAPDGRLPPGAVGTCDADLQVTPMTGWFRRNPALSDLSLVLQDDAGKTLAKGKLSWR